MIRIVTSVAIDAHGYVRELRNSDEAWSPRSAGEAVLDIELGEFAYVVEDAAGQLPLATRDDHGGRYLWAGAHPDDRNHLPDLAGPTGA